MRKGEAKRKILLIPGRCLLQKRNSICIVRESVMRHTREDREALRLRRVGCSAFEQYGELVEGTLQFAALEKRQPEIKAQGRDVGIHGQGLISGWRFSRAANKGALHEF